MADQIKVFELKIDVDAAIKSTSQLKTTTDNLKKTLKEFKDAGDTSSEAYVRTAAAVKRSNKEYNDAQTLIAKLLTLKGKEIKTIEQGNNALFILNKEWLKTASIYGKNSKEADELGKQHKKLKDRVNELKKGVGDTSSNIGRYGEGFKEAAAQSSFFGRAQRNLQTVLLFFKPIYKSIQIQLQGIKANYIAATKGTKGFSAAQKASAIGTNLVSAALKLFRIALISTGIGAIVVLLGSLVAWLTKTQAGLDFVTKAMAVLGTVVDVFIDRLSALFGAFTKFFSGDFAGGFEDIGKAVSGVGDELSREIKLVIELENALVKLQDKEIGLIKTQAERKKKIEELRLAAKDELLDLGERAKLLEQAGNLEKAILDDQLEVAKEQARISQAKLELANSTREDIKANAELQARVIELETESLKKQRSIEAEKQGLLKRGRAAEVTASKEAIANAKKVTDAAIKENQVRLNLFIEQNKGEAESLEEGLKLQEDIRDKKLALLDEQIKAGNKTQIEGELEALKIKNDFLEQQAQLTVDFADQELQLFKFVNQSRIAEGQLLTDELVSQEKARLEAVAEAERQALVTRLENGVISRQEYNEAIAAVDLEAKESKDEIELEQKEQKAEADAIDLENKRALQQEALEYDLEAQLNELNLKKQAELDAAEKTGADKSLIEAKYAELEKQTAAAVNANKLQLASQTFGNLASILGKESAAGKAAAIAQTTIDTYQGATAAYKSLAGIPIVGPVLGGIAAAAAVAGGIANVKKIASTKAPKAAKGITLQGNRHAQGGIDLFDGSGNAVVNAEGGENVYVVNRNASALINGLSTVNQMTGGVPLSTPVNFAADGGLIQRSIQTNQNGSPVIYKSEPINYDLMAQKIGEANLLLPTPVTDVKDVIGQVGSFNHIVDGANQ